MAYQYSYIISGRDCNYKKSPLGFRHGVDIVYCVFKTTKNLMFALRECTEVFLAV